MILASLVIDKIGHFIQERLGGYRHRQWLLDGQLQLQRLAYENAGIGTWINAEKDVPVTVRGELLGMLDKKIAGDPTKDAAMTGGEKVSFGAPGCREGSSG